jgi:hypothetical protein
MAANLLSTPRAGVYVLNLPTRREKAKHIEFLLG